MHDFGSPPDGWLHCILKPLRRQVHAKSLLAFQDEAALHIVESGAQLHLQRGRAHRAAHLEPRGRLHGSCSAGARCKRMRRSQWRLVEYPAWRHAGDAIPAGGASILRVVSGKGCEQRGMASRGGNESACVQFATGFPARTRKPRNKSVATASSILALRGCGFGGLDYLLLRASLSRRSCRR